MATTNPNVVSASEAARLLQIDKSLICRYCREGRIKAERFGENNQWFIHKTDLFRFKRNPVGNPNLLRKRG